MKQYLEANQLTKSRTNRNVGVRVTYLKCGHNGCPKRLHLLHQLVDREAVTRFQIQEVVETEHNHNVVIPRERGLTAQQKSVTDLCVERGQRTPKKGPPLADIAADLIAE